MKPDIRSSGPSDEHDNRKWKIEQAMIDAASTQEKAIAAQATAHLAQSIAGRWPDENLITPAELAALFATANHCARLEDEIAELRKDKIRMDWVARDPQTSREAIDLTLAREADERILNQRDAR